MRDGSGGDTIDCSDVVFAIEPHQEHEGCPAKATAVGLRVSNIPGRLPVRPRAAWLVLLVLAAALGVLWVGRSSSTRRSVSGTSEPSATSDASPDGGESLAGAESGESEARALVPLESGSHPEPRFQGRGEIRGHVETEGDVFPEQWRLVLSPSTSLVGRELAEERVIEFSGGVQDFAVSDLPLGGYDVKAESDGMNGLAQPILLDRRNWSPFVNLRLVPAGFLEGNVVDAEGIPAEGVGVALVPLPEGEPRIAHTDSLGNYRFTQVLDGSYLLFLGSRDYPLVREPQRIAFRAPALTVPRLELPPLSTLELTVVDEAEESLPGVRIEASSPSGGTFEGETDASGRLAVRHLPAGRYRIKLEHEGHASRRVTVELDGHETEKISLQLFP